MVAYIIICSQNTYLMHWNPTIEQFFQNFEEKKYDDALTI